MSEELYPNLVDRFIRYVKVNTRSNEESTTVPSDPKEVAFVDLQKLQVMLLLLISMVVEESVLSLQQMEQQTMQLKKQSQILLCRLQL